MSLDASRFRAVLFDLDGVITPTADLHEKAWATLFTAFLQKHNVRPYTADDYFAHIDGRPRYEAVRSLLSDRGVDVREGEVADPPGEYSVCALGNLKDATFRDLLAQGITPYERSIIFLDRVEALGLSTAIVSSSRNARAVLESAGLLGRFPLIVDGVVAAEIGLQGKPSPETYLYAAQQLDTGAAHCIVVEDAVSGVAAGKRGEFGLTVGVDRGAGKAALEAAGADIVVRELDEILFES